MRLSAWPSLVVVSCCRLDPSSYYLAFRLNDTVCRVACPLLPGFLPPLLSSIYTLSALQVTVVVPSGSLLRYRVVVTLTGRVCLSPRSERRLFLHLPGVWLESSRWVHPDGSSLSQSSIGTKTLRAPSLGVGAEPSRWGHPYRVVWRFSAHSIGPKASSVHLSLVAWIVWICSLISGWTCLLLMGFGAFVHHSSSSVIGVFFLVSVVLLPRSDLRFPSQRSLPVGRVRACCFLCIARVSGFHSRVGSPFGSSLHSIL